MEENKIVEKKKSKSLSILEDKQIAQAFYESGIFQDVKSAAQALVKIIAGREQGIAPIQAMSSVFIFNNNICYQTKVFISKIKKTKNLNYKIKQATEEICVIEFYENENLLGQSSYSVKQSAKAGLINKDSWKKYPQNMLFYRAMSNGIKMFMPQILDGAILYEDFDELANVKKSNAINVNMETGEIKEVIEEGKQVCQKEKKVIDVDVLPKTEEQEIEELF